MYSLVMSPRRSWNAILALCFTVFFVSLYGDVIISLVLKTNEKNGPESDNRFMPGIREVHKSGHSSAAKRTSVYGALHDKVIRQRNIDNLFESLLKVVGQLPIDQASHESHFPTKIRRIVIVAYFRSGSSFLGEILQTPPSSFYHFEPLHISGTHRIRKVNISRTGHQITAYLLQHILRCEFTEIPDYVSWLLTYKKGFLMNRNPVLKLACRRNIRKCRNTEFLEKLCRSRPLQVMKLVRLPLLQTIELIARDPDFTNTTTIVHLVRDPRGIIASRSALGWCQFRCNTLCSEISEDVQVFENFKKFFNGVDVIQVKFEEFASDPFNETRRLFERLGLKYGRSTEKYLLSHTTDDDSHNGPLSTRRYSKNVASKWKQMLSFRNILEIQNTCGSLITQLGYRLVDESDTEWRAKSNVRSQI
ncbi:carbohydrate sulfotransferase 1-like isoform X2 [Varroa destructor]|nr:carbohydrate sulfotransferase 1-like isoform X2 [Varroa destructor]